MSGFPINLDLTLYFDDLRKYSCIFVDLSKCKEVGDVEKHITSVFKLEDEVCLTHKKFLIPRCEDVQILQHYETLKVLKCDFFDLHIHKNKRPNNPACDQTALNLIQAEKTIDLSCRPKQRLKINICQSHCVYETPSTPFVENNLNIPHNPSSENNILSHECQVESKGKQKNKKKKYHLHNGGEELNDAVENSADILDMTVKKSKRKKYLNCFSTKEKSEQEFNSFSKDCDKINSHPELDHTSLRNGSHKKSKKRKKQLQPSEFNFDPTTSYGDTLDIGGSTDFNTKRLKKKCAENYGSISDLSFDGISLRDKKGMYNSTMNDNDLLKKKQKKQEKTAELVVNSDNGEYKLKVSNSNRKDYNSPIINLSETNSNQIHDTANSLISNRSLQDYKRELVKKVDSCINEITQLKPRDSSNSENQDVKSEFLDEKLKWKRVRKHGRKKKRERNAYMTAVGPVLNRITLQPQISTVLPSSEVAKHIFFTDDDFSEEMRIPATPPTSKEVGVQGSVTTSGNSSEVLTKQEVDSEKSSTWQQELIKLANSTSKPAVFHRSLPSLLEKTEPTQNLPCQTDTTNNNFLQKMENDYSIINEALEAGVEEVPKDLQDLEKCNGEIKAENKTEESTFTDPTVYEFKSKLQDSVKPIITDVQNINLVDYPIIDKVVAGDLILFKVMSTPSAKNEPSVSKPILAKVNDSTNFPEKITLQLMEGCEESYPCQKAVKSIEGLMIDLGWTEILEPRLFYP